MELSQNLIGQRISNLRKKKGFSQENLAKIIRISRSSLTQLELGNRGVDILELQKLSMALGFSLDEIMSVDYKANEVFKDSPGIKTENSGERTSIPELNVDKFKNILLYILERCAGKPNVGEMVLYKLLYFADFNYYELYEEHLSGTSYRKLPYGPVPQKIDSIINQMIEENQLLRINSAWHGFPQIRYLPLQKASLAGLKANEKQVIDGVIEQMSDWSAAYINDYAHNDLPWEVTEEGKEIGYELAFYRELPYSVRVYDENEA